MLLGGYPLRSVVSYLMLLLLACVLNHLRVKSICFNRVHATLSGDVPFDKISTQPLTSRNKIRAILFAEELWLKRMKIAKRSK